MTQKLFKNEIGRSMLEMLGILFIIGVLIIVGIVGYNHTIARYQANTLTNIVNQFALLCSHQIKTNDDTDCQSLVDITRMPNSTANADQNLFSLSVLPVAKSTCSLISKQNWSILWKLNNGSFSTGKEIDSLGQNCDNNMQLTFIFTHDLMTTEQAVEKCKNILCTPPATCVKGFCDCPEGKIYRNNACECIDDSYIGNNCDIPRKCPPKQFFDYFGACHDCNRPEQVGVSTNEKSHASCEACGNRYVTKGNTCEIKCPDGQFNSSGTCISCDDPIPRYSSGTNAFEESCLACGNRWLNGGYCALTCKEGQFFDYFGACHDCNRPEQVGVSTNEKSHASCEACGNRYVTKGNTCEIKKQSNR